LHGEATERDFTFVDDIVSGVVGAMTWVTTHRGYGTFNLGRSEPIVVRRVIDLLAATLGKAPRILVGTLEPGEAFRTAANVSRARETFGYEPRISIEEGIARWVAWLTHSPEAPGLLRP
jgi:UDP-glucuronate 4-epimerase